MKKNNNKNSSARRKLAAAIAMLMISTLLLSSATYAWFTMNKEVKVTNMQVKAHAEEGLLINEVALATSPTWDDEATTGQEAAIALRPASTMDLKKWWHANSKKVNIEAGTSGTVIDSANTVALSSGTYYKNITGLTPEIKNASGSQGTAAQANIYFEDATFGNTSGTCDPGEGYYVMYTYYLKSSNSSDLLVNKEKLMAKVEISKLNEDSAESGASINLDKSLRVGIKFDEDNYKIFAANGADASYYVTTNVQGNANESFTPQAYTTDFISVNDESSITIPNVNHDGIPVYVYLWFEGEDKNCKSENLTSVLDDLQVNITFRDADLGE